MARHKIDLMKPGAAAEIARITRKNVSKVMQIATVEFYRQVIIATPVDTGRARNGWNITVGTPSEIIPPEGNYAMPNIAQHGYETIISVSPDQVIYITNRVHYIEKLNKGSSKQAPAMFVELSAGRVQSGVAKLVRNSGQ